MSGFDTTHWSVILRARGGAGEAREALEDLCRTYRTPVLAYIRRCVRGGDAAEDLTQAFFVHFLEKETFSVADPAACSSTRSMKVSSVACLVEGKHPTRPSSGVGR